LIGRKFDTCTSTGALRSAASLRPNSGSKRARLRSFGGAKRRVSTKLPITSIAGGVALPSQSRAAARRYSEGTLIPSDAPVVERAMLA
jgi:hypothetical protein